MDRFVAEVLDLRDGLAEPRLSRVALSRHAAQRYSERVDFCIGPIEASARLREDAERSGMIVSDAPDWLLESRAEKQRAAAYLLLGEEYVLPLSLRSYRDPGLSAITLISRSHGSHLAERRRRRRSRKTKATVK